MTAPKGKRTAVTACGVTVHVDAAKLAERLDNDARLALDLASTDPAHQTRAMGTLVGLICGDEYDRAMDELQGDAEYLDAKRLAQFVTEACQQVEALKN